ncbi:hypothetical protein [Pseudonocardia sp. GCM10023141]|uniref:hypothetical protein n=1 Tax=Pseudonocardia sp. GCM10023141 TaxID=3252653 RepID=UPI00360A4FD2
MRAAAPADVGPAAAAQRVAVVSDASDFHREPGSTLLSGLLGTAALLREHAGIAATALLVTAEDTDELIADLRRVAPDFSGVYLTLTNPARAAAAQVALAGTFTVITDRQTTAIALTAAMLSSLDRRGIPPAAGRVVIVGAEHNPLLVALAAAAGIGEIDRWGIDDAHNFPLSTLTRRGALVIDLIGATRRCGEATAAGTSRTPIIAIDDPSTALVALPYLLAMADQRGHPPALPDCLACAHALAQRTPPGQLLPALSDPALSDIALSDPALSASAVSGPVLAAVANPVLIHRDQHPHPR